MWVFAAVETREEEKRCAILGGAWKYVENYNLDSFWSIFLFSFFFVTHESNPSFHIDLCMTDTLTNNKYSMAAPSRTRTQEIVMAGCLCLCLYNNIQTKSSCHFLCVRRIFIVASSRFCMSRKFVYIYIFYQSTKVDYKINFAFPHPRRRRLFGETKFVDVVVVVVIIIILSAETRCNDFLINMEII